MPRDPQTTACEKCQRQWPTVGMIRSLSSEEDSAALLCPTCAVEVRTAASTARRVTDAQAKLQEIVGALGATSAVALPTLTRIATQLAEEWEGPRQFVHFWVEQTKNCFDPAAGGKPGSKTGLDSIRTMAKLFEAASSQFDELPDTLKMTDQELRKQAVEQLKVLAIGEMLEEIPELAGLVAQRAEAKKDVPQISVEDNGRNDHRDNAA